MKKTLFAASLECVSSQDSLENNKEHIKFLIHCTAAGLGGVLKNIPKDKAIDLLRDYVDNVHFYVDNSGYLYVNDYNCVVIAHGEQKKLQGKSLFDHKDTKGKFVVQELAKAAKDGGGFVEYYWLKPGEGNKEVKKIGYVEPIPGTDFFIGTGVYHKNKK